ncbi:MAG: glycoside hydrolase 5 family protein [Bacteroidota bacterium]
MRKLTAFLFLLPVVLILSGCSEAKTESSFITVSGKQFIKDGKPYNYIGTNYWYGASLAADTLGGDRARLAEELDFLKVNGIDNLRVMVGAEGPDLSPFRVTPTLVKAPGVYSPALLEGLDYFLNELKKRDMHAILFLTNNWEWSGGMAQYVNWNGYGDYANPNVEGFTWADFFAYQKQFYSCDSCVSQLNRFIESIVMRTNRINGLAYRDDPTIMAWELANEPRPMADDNFDPFRKWIRESAALIRKLDKHHLITTGNEGTQGCSGSMELFEEIHALPEIDYLTIHIWLKNWRWYDANDPENTFPAALEKVDRYIEDHLKVAEKLDKPMVIEEFGLARDFESFKPGTPVSYRDRYYDHIFSAIAASVKSSGYLAGCNFWTFGGFTNPIEGQIYWKPGDPFGGDPPQEEQGLNSVFPSDSSTIGLIKKYNELLKR